MLVIGVTGGIGSGKSAVTARLAGHGAVIIDADILAREVVAAGTPGLDEIVTAFGPDVLTPEGELDRSAIGRLVFADAPARRALEQIIHPRVRARTVALAAAAPPRSIVVNDVPLLVESGLAPGYHLVLVVRAGEATRVRRLARGRGMAQAQAYARIRAQASDQRREEAADMVLDNDGTLDRLHAQIDTLWTDRLVPFEENLRERRAVWPTHAVVVPYDPTWPAQYARIAARITHATGPAALTLDHIGSTAIAGLAAKDTVDIQLGVSTLEDADALADTLAGIGLPPAPGPWWDNPRTPGGATIAKRLHGSADPARSVNLHIRVAGSESWRYALLMRDYLRADEETRSEYAALKHSLAGTDRATYADAKEPWFSTIVPRMEAWATHTTWS